jgi:hypothetical protein
MSTAVATTSTSTTTAKSAIEVTAGELADDLEDLLEEGMVRKISVSKDGRVIAEFPLAVGVAGAVFAAPLAAIAAIVALIADCTIEVERYESAEPAPTAPTTPAATV